MTSSLVGSEMCIRDRSKAKRPGHPLVCVCVLMLCPHVSCCQTAAAVCAVSYTHLTLPTICSV
eukprot:10786803-Prorocentrum_lima.AAC.1